MSQAHFDTYQEANRMRKAGKLQEALTGFEKALAQAQDAKDPLFGQSHWLCSE